MENPSKEEENPCLACLVTSNHNGLLEDEYVNLLLEREKVEYTSVLACNPNDKAQVSSNRFAAIHNILHIRGVLGFQFQTAYLSVTYLDQFLSLRILDFEKAWATELLSVACLSLAAKLQECNVPGLSLFQVGNIRFDVKFIRRMELLVLTALEWKMDSITPFSFLPYFIGKLFVGPPLGSTSTRIQELILATMKDVSLMDHYPSAIALAAVLMALDERLTRDALSSKIDVLPCSRFLDIDDVFVCYLIMQKLETKLTEMIRTPIRSIQMGSFQNSIASSSVSNKRKSLPFNENE